MTSRAVDPPSASDLRRWGIDPAWSRQVEVASTTGVHRWHVLDRAGTDPDAPTVVCVHGNPTWAALWTPVLAGLDLRHRVVAPDQLGMGYSDRMARWSYVQRVDDLDDLLRVLVPDGPLVLVAHDWGGAIAMGWAVDHPDRVAALVLANTGIAVPARRSAPWVIRLAASRGVHDLATRRTSLFVRGTSRLPGHRLDRTVRTALAAPYRSAANRDAVAAFVADIPFTGDHPSAAAIAEVAGRLGDLDVPVLLFWGADDPVFDDDFAADLQARFRHADLHRVASAGHLSPLEADLAGVAGRWLRARHTRTGSVPAERDVGGSSWSRLDARRHDDQVAFHDGAAGTSVTFSELAALVDRVASQLLAHGVAPGDRVAVLIPPSVDLVAAVYGCWRIGAVTVVADRGLGLAGLGRAIGGARVAHVVGPRRALVAARTLRWAPHAQRIDVGELTGPDRDADAVGTPALGTGPALDAPAAVLFTSGATGPAKGVRYSHRQLLAQRDALERCYGIGPDDRLVAAFAPFALYGPALGITSAVPDVDVTAPGELTAVALDAACASAGATLVFASPAALANVVATAPEAGTGTGLAALARVRTVMSAGAPVPVKTLRAMARLAPGATLHTPYGMTEVLPVADVDLVTIDLVTTDAVGAGRGVCVGRPVDGCEVRIGSLGFDPSLPVEPLDAGVTGEILVSAPWMSSGYDGLWDVERAARPVDRDGRVWHRSGDVGHLDVAGHLWVEGRSVHVVHTAGGPLTPVPLEVAVESCDGVRRAAAVGVGPVGVQELVLVVESDEASRPRRPRRPRRSHDRLATVELTDRVRAAVAPQAVAAVIVTDALPVDIRHNAKIDRSAVAARAERLLAGGGG